MMNVGHMIDNSQLDMIIGKWAEGTTDPVEYIRHFNCQPQFSNLPTKYFLQDQEAGDGKNI
jgi:hypothetical protein